MTSISSSLAASTPWTSSQRTGLVLLALTVSGLVLPIVLRSSITKMIISADMKKTPKTGYQSKTNSLMSPAGSAWQLHPSSR